MSKTQFCGKKNDKTGWIFSMTQKSSEFRLNLCSLLTKQPNVVKKHLILLFYKGNQSTIQKSMNILSWKRHRSKMEKNGHRNEWERVPKPPKNLKKWKKSNNKKFPKNLFNKSKLREMSIQIVKFACNFCNC